MSHQIAETKEVVVKVYRGDGWAFGEVFFVVKGTIEIFRIGRVGYNGDGGSGMSLLRLAYGDG